MTEFTVEYFRDQMKGWAESNGVARDSLLPAFFVLSGIDSVASFLREKGCEPGIVRKSLLNRIEFEQLCLDTRNERLSQLKQSLGGFDIFGADDPKEEWQNSGKEPAAINWEVPPNLLHLVNSASDNVLIDSNKDLALEILAEMFIHIHRSLMPVIFEKLRITSDTFREAGLGSSDLSLWDNDEASQSIVLTLDEEAKVFLSDLIQGNFYQASSPSDSSPKPNDPAP